MVNCRLYRQCIYICHLRHTDTSSRVMNMHIGGSETDTWTILIYVSSKQNERWATRAQPTEPLVCTCILPRVPDYCASLESNYTSNPVLVSGCVISCADYCASLRSQIPPATLYWFPVASFPVQGILSINAMDLESKYCYFYHTCSWDFVPYYIDYIDKIWQIVDF
jgi:hypothetical protein